MESMYSLPDSVLAAVPLPAVLMNVVITNVAGQKKLSVSAVKMLPFQAISYRVIFAPLILNVLLSAVIKWLALALLMIQLNNHRFCVRNQVVICVLQKNGVRSIQ